MSERYNIAMVWAELHLTRVCAAVHNSRLSVVRRLTKALETSVAKVHVTVKSVEIANAKLQGRAPAAETRTPPAITVRPASPSRTALAEAGQRALQSFNR